MLSFYIKGKNYAETEKMEKSLLSFRSQPEGEAVEKKFLLIQGLRPPAIKE